MRPGAFETTDGVTVSAVSADEMRDVDRVAVEDVGIDLLMMMENAGRDVASFVDENDPRDVVVLAGNGGNGGGGLACARHLANHDVPVSVVLDRPPMELTGAVARQFGVLETMDVEVDVGPREFRSAEVVIDALVGYGLSGPLRGPAADLVDELDGVSGEVVSLDVPSGIDATTGDAPGACVSPDSVVTLALPKTGLLAYGGQLVLADIGVPAAVYEQLDIEYWTPFAGGYLVEIESR